MINNNIKEKVLNCVCNCNNVIVMMYDCNNVTIELMSKKL